ncbi:MAG TPA: DUF1801 domain-containing protein [Nitrospira sp.]|nr:DUF1801 domain-containing protein [Nitrospira sp.]
MNRKRGIPKAVNAYLVEFPQAVQACLRTIRATIKPAASGAKETISYGIPTLKLNGPLIYFAGFKAHVSIYPMTATIQKQFKKALSPYPSGKGTAKFPLNQPIPYALIEQIARFRVKENLAKRIE